MNWLNKLCERGQFCSCFIDSFGKWNWGLCCKSHDHFYDVKGWGKLKADRKFFNCIRKKTNFVLASIMWLGVNTPIGWYKYYKAQKGEQMPKLDEIKKEIELEKQERSKMDAESQKRLDDILDETLGALEESTEELDEDIEEVSETEEDIEEEAVFIPIQDEEMEETYKRVKREKVENEQVSLNDTLHGINQNNRMLIDARDKQNKMASESHENFVNIMRELHYLKKHFMKINLTVIAVIGLTGYILGMNHSTISPYLKTAYEAVNIFKTKGE